MKIKKNMRKRISLLFMTFACVFAGFRLFAQSANINDYVIRTWTSAEGLPGNVICDVVQSDDGYLYLGSYECLVRFDGFDFTFINKYSDPRCSFISARSIFKDSHGALWIGSNDEGVQKIDYENYSFTILNTDNGLPNNSVRAFAEDAQGNIWIGTAGGVIYQSPDGKIHLPEAAAGQSIDHVLVTKLYCDTANRIWMLTSNAGGIYVYKDNAFHRYEALDAFGNNIPSAITQDNNGEFWVALSQGGLVRIKNGSITKVESGTILDSKVTNCIYCEKSGAVWFGTEKGVVFYKDGKFSVWADSNSVSNTSINQIVGDREGNIWVGADSTGLSKISLGKFRMTKTDTPVNAICEDKKGNVWIGSDNGILCYKDDVLVENDFTQASRGSRIRHIGLASNGDLLVNFYSKPAMVRYNGETWQSWSTDEGLAGNKTRVSMESQNGDLYVGTTTGLSIIKKDGQIINHTIANGMECEYIMCLYEDPDGYIWVGTDGGGLYIMKDGVFIRKITSDDGLCGNVIFKIFTDKNHYTWVCTGAGIARITEIDDWERDSFSSHCVNYTTAIGLGTDSVFQIIIDSSDLVWMISNRGISSVPYDDFERLTQGRISRLDCKFYTESDGLKSSGTNTTALSMHDSFGRLWFTMADGFAVYDPLKSQKVLTLPLIKIESVKIDDVECRDLSKTVVIPAGSKHIDIKYAGLSFISCERNRFNYKMDGFDDGFSDLTASRDVSYTNLKPGRYTFKVNVMNGEGVFCDQPGTVLFVQEPFIYQRISFWIATILGVIGLIIFIFIATLKKHKKQNLLLQTKIQMATVELQMAKDDSDRLLKNVLPASIAERLKGFSGEKTIADSFDNVTVLFSDIVGFTKKTSKASAEDIVSSLNNLISMFDRRAKEMGVEKIKTIGDAYMAACGVPVPNEKHAVIMLKFAIGMFQDLAEYNKTAKIKFNIRIGMNSGKVVAGVIGQNKFIYDIWGDTVNVASRMEQCCTPGHIRFTESVKENLLANHVTYKCREEEKDIKGKGLMMTYEIPEV